MFYANIHILFENTSIAERFFEWKKSYWCSWRENDMFSYHKHHIYNAQTWCLCIVNI